MSPLWRPADTSRTRTHAHEPRLDEIDVWRRWLGVEFRHLAALAAVAREGSFRRAAEGLGYVQSAISAQVGYLEQVLGTELVERSSGTGGTRLTAAGTVLLSHVEHVLTRFEAARMDIRALVAGTDALVRIGLLDGVGPRKLPEVLRAFSEQLPEVSVVIEESASDEQNFERLARGDLELMITELPLPEGPFDFVPLARDAYVLLVPDDSPLVGRARPLGADDLTALPLLLPASGRRRDLLEDWLHKQGIRREAWLRARSVAALQALVAARQGAAIVPAMAIDPDDPSTVALQAPGLLPERLIVLVRHRERLHAEAVRAFVQIAERAFTDLAQ